mmetsp:Transcript_32398/g.95469  ORF Transcript_32398/g.95469 Transcript_32398/m.95469 type:complete len:233 (-) Transcript_32398:587-1285(-)
MASTADLPVWVEACRTLAPAAAWVVFLSPFSTLRGVARSKTVGGLPALPYSSMVLNCSLWIIYSVLKNEPTIRYANSVGLALGTYYFYVFYNNCSPTATGLPGTLKDHVQGTGLIVAVALLIAVLLPRDTASELIGKAAVIFCVILFASPLSVLREAIMTKSAKNIPLPFALASTVNTLLWSVSGVIALRDFNVYFPNLLGLACSVAQLVVISMYGSGEKKNASEVELPLTR